MHRRPSLGGLPHIACSADIVQSSDGAKKQLHQRKKLLDKQLKVLRSSPLWRGVLRAQNLVRDLRKRPNVVRAASSLLCALFFFAMILRKRAATVPIREIAYSQFIQLAREQPSALTGLQLGATKFLYFFEGQRCFTQPVRAAPNTVQMLLDCGVPFTAMASRDSMMSLVSILLPLIWLFALYNLMRRQTSNVTGKAGKEAQMDSLNQDLTFEDVAGIDSAKGEVREVVDMLRNPGKYGAAGARLPAGLLMVGPPGTGKTLLARVMAVRAQVPFYYCSGSDFVELFVGRGAARMRQLFQKAAKVAPAIIFIDELDALGKQRSMRMTVSNDEAEQTLNQLLACMDGMDTSNNGVIVIGATNRYDILDNALTRPGRFDRIVQIELPDEQGREQTLGVHTRDLQLDENVNLRMVAELTPRFSGAELAALVNEAAIRAVRRNSNVIKQEDLTQAVQSFFQSRRNAPENMILSQLLNAGKRR